jgi:hypothetical protein
MALRPCKECGREISTEARTCPHCGKKDPTGSHSSRAALGCLSLILIGVFVSLLSSKSEDEPREPSAVASPSYAAISQTPPEVGSQWTYSHDADEMSGKTSHVATVISQNTVDFDFPYNGPQHGRLTIRRHPRWGSDVIVGIEKGQLLCTSYEGCTVLVRFDDGEPLTFSANPPGDHSTEAIFIENYDRFMTKMQASKRIRISPKVYREGNVVFTFDVSGFDSKKFRGK